jgi:hypothetical protein
VSEHFSLLCCRHTKHIRNSSTALAGSPGFVLVLVSSGGFTILISVAANIRVLFPASKSAVVRVSDVWCRSVWAPRSSSQAHPTHSTCAQVAMKVYPSCSRNLEKSNPTRLACNEHLNSHIPGKVRAFDTFLFIHLFFSCQPLGVVKITCSLQIKPCKNY